MIVEPKREILLGPLLRAGVRRSWAARDHFLRLGALPLLAIVAISLPLRTAVNEMGPFLASGQIPADVGPMSDVLLLAAVYAVVMSIFAVNWIRQLTLGTGGAPGVGLSLGARHLRFFVLILAISIGCVTLASILLLVLVLLGLGPVVGAAMVASLVLWAAVIVRLSPSWIGTALDAPMSLGVAWRRTAGQGFKLLIALFAVDVPLMMVQQLIMAFFTAAGLVDAVPLTFTLVLAVVQLIGTAAQLAILVTAFPHFLRETV